MTQNAVDVWIIALDVPSGVVRAHWNVLDSAERERAARFVRDRDADRFTVCRAAVRRILASYSGVPASEIAFAYSRHGKPRLCGRTPLEFNVSHSGSVGMCAIARAGTVGVDVECVDRDLDFEPLAERFFSPLEVAALRRVPAEERRLAFYRCWTRKEAYLKSTGLGLSHPLGTFSVPLDEDCGARPLRWSDGGDPERGQVMGLDAPTGYVAALALAGGDDCLIVREMTWSHEHGAACELG